MIIIDPVANMTRTMINVAVNCAIPPIAGGSTVVAAAAPAQ